MIVGHFATAFIAHKHDKKPPLLFFLVISQLQDLLWLIFHYLGLEVTSPTNVLEASFKTIKVDMLYSHDLIPSLFWVLFAFLLGKFIYKSNKTGLIAALLILGHGVLDSLAGFNHHIFGQHTHSIGLGLYDSNIYLALAIETVFTLLVLAYVYRDKFDHIKENIKSYSILAGVYVYGMVFCLLTAEKSFSELFNLEVIDFGFNTAVPTLAFTYIGMLWLLNKYGKIS